MCKDRQDELVVLYIGFDGYSDDSYGIHAHMVYMPRYTLLEKYDMSRLYTDGRTHTQRKVGQHSAWAESAK